MGSLDQANEFVGDHLGCLVGGVAGNPACVHPEALGTVNVALGAGAATRNGHDVVGGGGKSARMVAVRVAP